MSLRAPRSKTAVIAGILAGLLAAGLAGYYAYQQRAPATPTAAARAAPAAKAGSRSKEQGMTALMALPELKAWSARIEKNSGGTSHGAVIQYDEAPLVVEGKTYWQVSFVENSPQAAHRWESFLVARDSDEILVEDLSNDELLSLERWRKEKQPLQRAGGN